MPRRLISGSLPTEIRRLLEQWYASRGGNEPPPCAISDSNIRTVYTTDTGKPARYEHKDGERLDVMHYTLPELAGAFKAKHVVIAQGPTHGPFIISYQRRLVKMAHNAIPYFVWQGLRSSDASGYEASPSVKKIIMSHGEACTTTSRSDNNPDEIEGEGKGAVKSGSPSSTESPCHLEYADEGNWTEPNRQDVYTTIPQSIRTLLHTWYSHKGSEQPPPCAILYARTKFLKVSRRGISYAFTHKSLGTMTVNPHLLPEYSFASGKKAYLVIAKGSTSGLFVVGYVGDQWHNPSTPFHIWEGLGAQNSDGWEERPSIKRDLVTTKANRRTSAANPNGRFVDSTTEDSECGFIHDFSETEMRLPFQPLSVPARSGPSPSSADHTRMSRHVLPGNPMPKRIKKLINEWSDQAGPSFKLESLPCATTSPPVTLSQTAGGRRAVWRHVNGQELAVQMYPLRGTQMKDGSQERKIIVARGHGLEDFVISYKNTGDNRDMIAFHVWRGIEGDQNGFEDGISVQKILQPKGAITLKYGKSQTPDSRNLRPMPATKDRKRKSAVDDTGSTLTATQGLAKHLRSCEAQVSPSLDIVRPSPEAIKTHMKNNAIFLFYSPSSPTPRARPFSACDSVQKLFTHAIAGDVFDDTARAGSVKVLSIRFGGIRGEKEVTRNLHVIDGDEEGFEELVAALEAMDWWVTGTPRGGREVEGSGTVEVRKKG